MDDESKASLEKQSKDLRADLKRWEMEWAQTHHGKKPGRQDIKDHPDIAQKYKVYNKCRATLEQKRECKPTKRKPDPGPSPVQTPLKRTKHAQTPSKQQHQEEEFMNTPAISRKLFSPAPVTSLGPTPQRDGRVLGLFDLLVERELGTPSRKEKAQQNKPSHGSDSNVLSTPSRRTTSTHDHDSARKPGRTPTSASKTQISSMFATPNKKRLGSIDSRTPSSISKLRFDTPAFLKRHSFPAVDEKAVFTDPSPLKLPRKPLVRGLSEIVASLRKVEEEALDDDLEALRDVEENDGTRAKPTPVSPSSRRASDAPSLPSKRTENEAPSRPILLGGFDDEELYDSPVEDGVDHNGNPLPVYKKKGQKRTTRKINMRPVMTRRPQTTSIHQASGTATQERVSETPRVNDPYEDFQDENNVEVDDNSDDQTAEKGHKKESKSSTAGTVRKVARKVNELAHANFRRLKLRNKGGGAAHKGRFGRRR